MIPSCKPLHTNNSSNFYKLCRIAMLKNKELTSNKIKSSSPSKGTYLILLMNSRGLIISKLSVFSCELLNSLPQVYEFWEGNTILELRVNCLIKSLNFMLFTIL